MVPSLLGLGMLHHFVQRTGMVGPDFLASGGAVDNQEGGISAFLPSSGFRGPDRAHDPSQSSIHVFLTKPVKSKNAGEGTQDHIQPGGQQGFGEHGFQGTARHLGTGSQETLGHGAGHEIQSHGILRSTTGPSTVERVRAASLTVLRTSGRSAQGGSIGQLVGMKRSAPVEADDFFDQNRDANKNKKKKGGSIQGAIEVAKSGKFSKTLSSFRSRFFAASSAKSRASKRAEVLRLAKAVAGDNRVLPLSKDLVEAVGAALKESGMRSGVQYLTELKLLHVEAGYEIPAWLKRTLDVVSKALNRERGPTVRALEVRIADLEEDKLKTVVPRRADPVEAGIMFVWASIWMLREIEVRNMQVGHVVLRTGEKAVSIFLPSSKADQQGKGIRRTLRCCGKMTCRIWCPWSLACGLKSAAAHKNFLASSPLFVTERRAQTKKAANIAAWKRLFGNEVSGHSPRRSGAMFYVRAGLPIQELAFLGRWKSNIVLNYAEEALQERPMRVPDEVQDKMQALPDTPTGASAPSTPAFITGALQVPEQEAVDSDVSITAVLNKPRDLWVVTKGRGWRDRPRHKILKASWNLPMSQWSTSCGWLFAEKSSEFFFVMGSAANMLKCHKCQALEEGATSQMGTAQRPGLKGSTILKKPSGDPIARAKKTENVFSGSEDDIEFDELDRPQSRTDKLPRGRRRREGDGESRGSRRAFAPQEEEDPREASLQGLKALEDSAYREGGAMGSEEQDDWETSWIQQLDEMTSKRTR
eukprot:s616_g2.t1